MKALKAAVLLMLDGDSLPKVLMTVIRFCINTDHHELKKLLMLFWEAVPKYNAEHKLLPEMILVGLISAKCDDVSIAFRCATLCAMT